MAWHKTSRHVRGYGTAWDKLRLQALERDSYLCVYCLARTPPRITGAVEVDHRESKAKCKASGRDADTLGNLASTCAACHRYKSAAEQGRTLRHRVGLDGYPCE